MTTSTAHAPARLNWFWRLLMVVVGAVFPGLLRWRLSATGLDNVPSHGPAVVTFNHHSYVDYVFIGYHIVRSHRRPVRLLGKAEIWDNPVTRWLATKAKAVPVHRTGTRGGALREAVAALRDGDLIGLAPEQTISRSFELLPFASGAARMAQQAQVPVVPSASWGSHRFMTKGHGPHLVIGLPVLTTYGDPIHIGPDDDLAAATERIRMAIEALVHGLQERYPVTTADTGAWWQPRRLGGTAPAHAEVLAAHEASALGRRTKRSTGVRDASPVELPLD